MRYINQLIATLIATTMIIGCSDPIANGVAADESLIKETIRLNLKDPDSAKFGQITIGKKNSGYTIAACATFNAKNSFGGFTGDQQAYLEKEGDTWLLKQITEWSHRICTADFGK